MDHDVASKRLCRLVAGFLRDQGYAASLEALQRECKAAREPEAGLPDLVKALEALELAKRPIALQDKGPLDLDCRVALPQDVKHTLETVHAANILSICYHELRRRSFDTAIADYVEESVPCFVTTATDRTVKFTSIADHEVVELFEPGHGPFLHVAFDPSGPRMALASMTGHLLVIDLHTRETLFAAKDHAKYAVRLAYSPDGRHLASLGYDKAVRVYDCESYKLEWTHTFATNPEAVLFLSDGQLVVSRRDSCHLIVVSRDWQARLINLNEHDDSHISFSVLDIALHPSGEYLSLQTDTINARILLLPVAPLLASSTLPTKAVRTLYTFAEQSAYSLPRHAWLADGTAVAVTGDAGLVRIIDVAHGLVRSTLRAHGDAAPGARRIGPGASGSGSSVVRDVCVLPLTGGKAVVASVGFDRTIRIAEG